MGGLRVYYTKQGHLISERKTQRHVLPQTQILAYNVHMFISKQVACGYSMTFRKEKKRGFKTIKVLTNELT